VVVFEDRAQVVRRGRAELPAGQVALRVSGISPVVADRTLQAKLGKAPDGSRVSDIRVMRDFRSVIDPDQTGASEVEKTLRDVSVQHQALRFKEAAKKNQLALVEQMTHTALDDMTVDVAWDRSTPDEWRQGLRQLSEREATLRSELLDLQQQIEDIREKQDDLERRSLSLDRPDNRVTADIVVEAVLTTQASVDIELTYIVPAVCWRPLHTAVLEKSGADNYTVTFSTDGCIWQNCGEAWNDVQLQFSTQRPSLGFEPPLLGEDILISQERPEIVEVVARDQVIATTGLGRTIEATDELPGIDDGGVPITIKARHTASIPSDGMPYRVKISEFTSGATVALVTMAELNPSAVTKVTLEHQGDCPILAGPVELIRNHGIVGRTSVLYVAPGERFALGFGPDPAIRVRRKVAEVEPKQAPLSRFVAKEHSVTLLVCNIGDVPKHILFTERIPVSEVEQVVIEFDASQSTVESKPDDDGIISWDVALPPGGTKTFCLRYTVKRRKQTVAAT
jgi:uncharacterized protein (TIGR02231 family)